MWGPVATKALVYIQKAFNNHLSHLSTYKYLSDDQATIFVVRTKTAIEAWLKKFGRSLTKTEQKFLNHHLETNESIFVILYLMLKALKTLLKMLQFIVSCGGSLLSTLGIWVDQKIQSVTSITNHSLLVCLSWT